MMNGTVRRQDLLTALLRLGAQVRHQGGETMAVFKGTTIIIGRKHFSRAMLRRVERKLGNAGITRYQLESALDD